MCNVVPFYGCHRHNSSRPMVHFMGSPWQNVTVSTPYKIVLWCDPRPMAVFSHEKFSKSTGCQT
uniref:Uncharacterized protein n=1 Tax=Anguilla anguilla TaxID=7936 RepID=A0A0E9TJD3_ANGAN